MHIPFLRLPFDVDPMPPLPPAEGIESFVTRVIVVIAAAFTRLWLAILGALSWWMIT